MLSQKSQASAAAANSQASQTSDSKKRTARQAGLGDFFAKAACTVGTKRPKLATEQLVRSKPNPAKAMPVAATPATPATSVKSLQSLINFSAPMASVQEYVRLFGEIADAYLNHTVL